MLSQISRLKFKKPEVLNLKPCRGAAGAYTVHWQQAADAERASHMI